MTPLPHRVVLVLLALGTLVGLPANLHSQPANPPALAVPVLPPIPKSPVESFRELLEMNPAEREKFLAGKPPQLRERLEAKIKEYSAMTPEVRESELRATQLYWYLNQFIQSSGSNYNAQLATVPEPYRQIVAERVRQFSILPPPLQKDVLDHKTTAVYFLGQNTVVGTNRVSPPMPPLPQSLTDLSRLSAVQRQNLYSAFEDFFNLSSDDQQKVLRTLPFAQRQQVEKVLSALQNLPTPQRRLGVQAIGKLVNLTDDQQRQFFQNAAHWQQISPEERGAWLRLVNQLPPMPPGVIMPPDLQSTMATNAP